MKLMARILMHAYNPTRQVRATLPVPMLRRIPIAMAVAKHFGPVAACILGNICAGVAQYLMTVESVRV